MNRAREMEYIYPRIADSIFHRWAVKNTARVSNRSRFMRRTLVESYFHELTGLVCETCFLLANNGRNWTEATAAFNRKLHTGPAGDGGSDFRGLPVDVKGSFWRYRSRASGSHHLWINPSEFRPNWTYVLALWDKPRRSVRFVGWAESSDLERRGNRWERLGLHLRPMGDLCLD